MNQSGLEGNIVKYNLFKIFTKRVFLPLIAIHLTLVGKVSLEQLGIIASTVALTQILLEIPTGYIADKWGHKKAIVLGSFITTISVLPYIFMPNFYGGLIAAALFFAGASFGSGAAQAFMHETLMGLGRENEYTKVMGKAQSYGLLGNVVLIALVPLTYQIDKNLPFILGFICLFASFLVALSFKKPKERLVQEHASVGFISELKKSLTKTAWTRMVLVFLIFGVSSSAFDQSIIYKELIFLDLGIPIKYFGFILAFGSLLAALGANHIHRLKALKPENFYLFDIAYVSTLFVLVGLSKNPILSILVFAMFPAYDRTRNIIYESQLFEEFPNIKYKSTLISILNFFTFGNGIWIPLVLAFSVTQTNVIFGHFIFGILLLVILIPVLLTHNLIQNKNGGGRGEIRTRGTG